MGEFLSDHLWRRLSTRISEVLFILGAVGKREDSIGQNIHVNCGQGEKMDRKSGSYETRVGYQLWVQPAYRELVPLIDDAVGAG